MADINDALVRALLGAQFGASNSGEMKNGLPGGLYGEQNAPAYGGSMPIPGTPLSMVGQYQQYPGMKPNIGVGLRFGMDF